MKLLAIDTSTHKATVALSVDEKLYYAEQNNLREHAQRLLPMVEELLRDAQIKIKDLDGIVLGQGPGSFTGLRIACSVVKGLAYPYDLPVYPVSSLAAIAEEFFYSHSDLKHTALLTLIDARMQEVYWNYYAPNGSSFNDQVGPISSINLLTNEPLNLAGVGFETYLPSLPEAIAKNCLLHKEIYPDARAMIRLVESGKVLSSSAREVLPIYVRNQVTQGSSHG